MDDTTPSPTSPTESLPSDTIAATRTGPPRWPGVVAIIALVVALLAVAGTAAALFGPGRGGRGDTPMGWTDAGARHPFRSHPHGGPTMLGDRRGDHGRDLLDDLARGAARDERRDALATALGVTTDDLEDAIDAVQDDLPTLLDDTLALDRGERRAAMRDSVLDALASELGVTRSALDAAIAGLRGPTTE